MRMKDLLIELREAYEELKKEKVRQEMAIKAARKTNRRR